ncbi:hypothetical protein [Streptomyces sp. DW26H14]|uniref:hypothetical protein n=1 Tax=Streptomyces sp. DW26H14 TaxID=3435395 RepID=UPI00403E0A07
MAAVYATVRAESPDGARTWLVAECTAPTPRLALRWLRWRACVLAERIDPTLDAFPGPLGALRVVPADPAVDRAAQELRAYVDSLPAADAALLRLTQRRPYEAAVTVGGLRYVLAAAPVPAAPVPAAPVPAGPVPAGLSTPHEGDAHAPAQESPADPDQLAHDCHARP